MGIMNLPDYLTADQIIKGANKAYIDNSNDFKAEIYKKDGSLGQTIALNPKMLSAYDGHNHDQIDQHKLQLTARGPALADGIWSEVLAVYLNFGNTYNNWARRQAQFQKSNK